MKVCYLVWGLDVVTVITCAALTYNELYRPYKPEEFPAVIVLIISLYLFGRFTGMINTREY